MYIYIFTYMYMYIYIHIYIYIYICMYVYVYIFIYIPAIFGNIFGGWLIALHLNYGRLASNRPFPVVIRFSFFLCNHRTF